MIAHLATAVITCLLLLNLTGLALAGLRFTGSYLLARVASPLALCLGAFFVEHFAGLGRLVWVWPLATAGSLYLIWRERDRLRPNWRTEAVFLAGFGYAFAWRFAFPDIFPSSEKLTDLAFLNDYLPGGRLPPVDVWLPPYRFDVYYSFQHYGSALMGRIFGMGPGLTYNLSFCVLVGLTVLAAAGAVWLFGNRSRWSALALVAFTIGGTGVSPLRHLLFEHAPLHASMRFVGGSARELSPSRPLGAWLLAHGVTAEKQSLDLPAETFSYMAQLGDHHPPMSGFLLLAVGLLAIALIEEGSEARAAQALLGATVPLTLIADAWNLPLAAALLGIWVVSRLAMRKPVDWLWLGGGLGGSLLLAYPFLSRFGANTLEYGTALRWVPGSLHTPWMLGLLLGYPLLLLLAFQLGLGERTSLTEIFCLFWIALLVFSEVFFVDDVYSGRYERFNTALKWWPWIYAGAILSVGAFSLGSKRRWCRWATAGVLGWVSLYGIDLGWQWVQAPKPSFGRLDGAAWLTRDAAQRPVLEYLQAQPRGRVLQRLEDGSFTNAPGLIMHAGQIAYMGWPEHEKLWRGYRSDIDRRYEEVNRFYRGELPDSAGWLAANQIDHVLWLPSEAKLPPGTWDRINQQIAPYFLWREFSPGAQPTGVWTRRPR